MRKVLLFSMLLILGLAGSQVLPAVAGQACDPLSGLTRFLAMLGLAFIMMHVDYEFEVDKRQQDRMGEIWRWKLHMMSLPHGAFSHWKRAVRTNCRPSWPAL